MPVQWKQDVLLAPAGSNAIFRSAKCVACSTLAVSNKDTRASTDDVHSIAAGMMIDASGISDDEFVFA